MEKQTFFSETVKTEGRTYFFDLKEASNGTPYLCITSSQKNKEGAYDKTRIYIFEDGFEQFSDALAKAMKSYSESAATAA